MLAVCLQGSHGNNHQIHGGSSPQSRTAQLKNNAKRNSPQNEINDSDSGISHVLDCINHPANGYKEPHKTVTENNNISLQHVYHPNIISETVPRTPLLGDGLRAFGVGVCPGKPPIIVGILDDEAFVVGFAPGPGFLNAEEDGANLIGVPTVGVDAPLVL